MRTAIASATGFAPEVLDELRSLADEGSEHVAALAPLRDALAGVEVVDLLRATRREPADPLEQRLLDIGDRCYRLVVTRPAAVVQLAGSGATFSHRSHSVSFAGSARPKQRR